MEPMKLCNTLINYALKGLDKRVVKSVESSTIHRIMHIDHHIIVLYHHWGTLKFITFISNFVCI